MKKIQLQGLTNPNPTQNLSFSTEPLPPTNSPQVIDIKTPS